MHHPHQEPRVHHPSPTSSRRGPVTRVAIGYLGGSWVVLQVVEVLSGLIAVPVWVGPGAMVLLLIGLFLVLGTAWVQADPATTRKEEAGEVPTDWEVAPRDAWSDLSRGRLPHLTWGRTLLGGVVGLSLLFGSAGTYVLITQGWDRGQVPAAGSDSETRLAILPFTTSGGDLQVYEEGMVELLSTNLDGLGGLNAIDSRTVLARWDEIVESGRRPDLDTSLRAAGATGATHALVGAIVDVGGVLRLTGRLYQLGDGRVIGDVQVEGPADETLSLVDQLSVDVVREVIGAQDGLNETGIRPASLTTPSIFALERYLEAESFYRRGDFTSALPLLDEAVLADSTFALAILRRAQTLAWTVGIDPDSLAAARLRIRDVLDRLAPRDAVLAEAGIIDFADRDPTGVSMLRTFVERYPDDAEGWYQLSDFLLHLNDLRGGTRDEVLNGFDRAVELGPRFAPYYIHSVEGALMRGDSARARQLLDRFDALGGEATRAAAWRTALAMLFPESDWAGGLDMTLAGLEIGALRVLMQSDRPQVLADGIQQWGAPADVEQALLMRAGRWSQLSGAILEGPLGDVADPATWLGLFELRPDEGYLGVEGLPAELPPEWTASRAEAVALVATMIQDRDDGTGADPLLLAHLAERAGDRELAMRLFGEESWREFGPAAVYRLARLLQAEGRPDEALGRYREFLELWSGADAELPPVLEARSAVERLEG